METESHRKIIIHIVVTILGIALFVLLMAKPPCICNHNTINLGNPKPFTISPVYNSLYLKVYTEGI